MSEQNITDDKQLDLLQVNADYIVGHKVHNVKMLKHVAV